jgi:hypothetical protein
VCTNDYFRNIIKEEVRLCLSYHIGHALYHINCVKRDTEDPPRLEELDNFGNEDGTITYLAQCPQCSATISLVFGIPFKKEVVKWK